MASTRFPILFTGANKAMAVLGITQGSSFVDVGDDLVRVRLSWAFQADIPRENITAAEPYDKRVWGWGAHGWDGRWLVNGSSKGLVELTIEPTVRAKVAGFPPIKALRTLRVSVPDRDALIATLSPD